MTYQSGKDDFSKEEIIDILKQNASLYKDEQEFVDYIVELAMYLIDRHYDKSRISPWKTPEPPPTKQTPSPSPPPTLRSEDTPAPGLEEGESLPPRASELKKKHQYDIDPLEDFQQPGPRPFEVASAPPPPPTPDPLPPPPEIPGRIRIEETPGAKDATSELRKKSKQGPFDLESPLATPAEREPKPRRSPQEPLKPDLAGGEDDQTRRSRLIDVENLGRARVYRVVRPYKSASVNDAPCPVCGSMVSAEEKQCPGCGHLM